MAIHSAGTHRAVARLMEDRMQWVSTGDLPLLGHTLNCIAKIAPACLGGIQEQRLTGGSETGNLVGAIEFLNRDANLIRHRSACHSHTLQALGHSGPNISPASQFDITHAELMD